MKTNDLEYASYGKLLIKLQNLETIIKMYVSLLNTEIKGKRKYNIKDLSARSILDDSNNGTKQTLGQLIFIIKSEVECFEDEDFNELLEKRNIFIHKFFKEYLSHNAKNKSKTSSFINRLWNLTDKFTNIFNGLISISVKKKSNGKVDTSGIESNEKDLYIYLLNKIKK